MPPEHQAPNREPRPPGSRSLAIPGTGHLAKVSVHPTRAIRLFGFPGLARLTFLVLVAFFVPPPASRAEVIHEVYSPYHHILVLDEGGVRTLSFDGTRETRMSLRNPLEGHFGYTELFHYAWLWNTNLARVVMLGLGGGSTQRSFLHYYPRLHVDSVEIDPAVVGIASNYFRVTASDRHRILVEDGRTYLRRTTGRYDLILLDAYVKHRYGSSMPPHLATREFFEIARDRLTTNGILAYNVITVISAGGSDALRALGRTLQAVFPQVYQFQATDSLNVVLVATRETRRLSMPELRQRAAALAGRGFVTPPGLFARLGSFRLDLPPDTVKARVLTDDYAPIEALQVRPAPRGR